jgi:hypothetical protein
MTRQTSIAVYEQIKNQGLLSRRRWQVYDVLFRRGPLTQNEACRLLAEEYGLTNKPSVTPRFAELEKRRVIHAVGKRQCDVTGETCLAYDVTGLLPTDPPDRPMPGRRLAVVLADLNRLRLENDALRAKLAKWGRPTDAERRHRQVAPIDELFHVEHLANE